MTRESKRIQLLDLLRGFAVLGTLGTNIWIFAYLGDLNYIFTFDHNEWWADFQNFVRISVLFLVNGKLLGLLTVMFGAGLELKYQQSLRRGRAWPGTYIWTCLILLLEGLIHYTLVLEYDILMSYGVTAIITACIVRGGDRAIRIGMKLAGGFHGIMMLLILALGIYLGLTGEQISIGDFRDVVSVYKEGSWRDQVEERLANFWILRSEVIFVIPMNMFLFLLGVRLMRAGVFAPDEQGRMQRKKLLLWGLGAGIPLNLLIFVPGGYFDAPVRYLFAPVLSLGYIGIIAVLSETMGMKRLWNCFAKVGRMALSCYVLQNVLSSIIFYGWGFGLGGKVDSATIVLLWAAISGFQMVFATLWLKRFPFGPMEYARKFAVGLFEKP